ncbi:MAG: DNA repair protein RecO [Verrucomicrobia bacterium]|nr:DNA repair protein RecO [Verrucomicrobiota bacterium]
MIESATGVVLRTHRMSETSLIVRWLTQDAGRLSTVAKGAITFNRSGRSDLHALREVSVREFHFPVRQDIRRLQLAAYCTALLEQTTESDTPLPGLFDLFKGLLGQLSVCEARPRLVFAFELKLLAALGLFPALDQAHLAPSTDELAFNLAQSDWSALQQLNPPSAAVKELSAFLHRFLSSQLGKVPGNRKAALET